MKSSINSSLSSSINTFLFPHVNLSRFDVVVNEPLTYLSDFGIIKSDMTDMSEITPKELTMELAVFIYGIKDPRTTPIRYVGQTAQPWHRLKTHVYEAKRTDIQTDKNVWVRGILAENVKPEMVILEATSTKQGGVLEASWQNKFNTPTNKILNRAKGCYVAQASWQNITSSMPLVPFEKTCKEFNLDPNIYMQFLFFKNSTFFIDLPSTELWAFEKDFNEIWRLYFFQEEYLANPKCERIKFYQPGIKVS